MAISTIASRRVNNKSDLGTNKRWYKHRPDTPQLAAYFALALAVGFNLQQLAPEVAIRIPRLNDDVLHLLALRRTVESLLAAQDPTDAWLPSIGLGFPLFHYYQHLAYFPPALVFMLLQGSAALPDVLDWTRYLVLSLFPLSIYWSLRRFGLDHLSAAMAGVCAPLVATNALLGFDFGSYVWRGSGLYTQLWGMFLLPIAVARAYVVLRDGRGYFWAALLLAATLLCHLIMGYIAFGSLVVLTLVAASTARDIWPRVQRLVVLVIPTVLATSYFVVPFLLDGAYMNRSVWELPEKYNSYGYAWVLGASPGRTI